MQFKTQVIYFPFASPPNPLPKWNEIRKKQKAVRVWEYNDDWEKTMQIKITFTAMLS
jgi:hypothetical protein